MDNVTQVLDRLHSNVNAAVQSARMTAIEDAYEAYREGVGDGYADALPFEAFAEGRTQGYLLGVEAGRDEASKTYMEDVAKTYKNGYLNGLDQPVDTGYIIEVSPLVARKHVAERIKRIIRNERKDAYKSGFEEAEEVYERMTGITIVGLALEV